MKTDKHNLKFSKVLFKGAFIYNPVLTQAIGICTIVAIGTTLKISLLFSLLLSALLIICEVLASLFLKRLSRWLRIAVYMLLSTAALLPVTIRMNESFSDITAAMGLFLPLLAANSLIVIRCEIFGVKNNVRNSLFDALAASLGFTVVSAIVGAVREIMAFGTLFGKTVSNFPRLSGIALPFGGLFTIGFLAAFHKWIILKKFPRQPTNTFNLRTAFDTPVLKNEGIRVTSGKFSFMRDPVHGNETDEGAPEFSEEERENAKKLFMLDSDDEDDTSLEDILNEKRPYTVKSRSADDEEKKEGEK